MEGIHETSASYTIPVTSYDTSLCIIPPVEQCEHINTLRELYDKAYGRWPAHINLIYPFVVPEHLPQAQQQIQAHLQRNLDSGATRNITLNSAGLFRQRHNSTAFVQESRDSSDGSLETLRSLVLQALGHNPTPHNFHLTAGQTEDNSMSSLEFLLSKVRLLPTLDFNIGSLAILVRERTPGKNSISRMRLWGSLDISSSGSTSAATIPEYWLSDALAPPADLDQDADAEELSDSATAYNRTVQPGKTFAFNQTLDKWVNITNSERQPSQLASLMVSSYNVLVDSEYPPARDRDPLLIRTLLSNSAQADIVVLQEVSDDFLSSLLNNTEVQSEYPFTSHAPPSQPDIGPLPSLRNVVVISKWPFRWELVPFHRRHKGAVIAVFNTITPSDSLVVAGVHLTCGLTDGSVAAKKVQVQNLIGHLTRQYSAYPWIIAGDFNIATSAHTINNALKNKSISSQTGSTLADIESLLCSNGLLDSWTVAQAEQISDEGSDGTDELFEGEAGATFDPRNNILAAATSGTSQNRPQRYDRILFRPQDVLRVTNFNAFGLPVDANGTSVVPSDHYGVRALLQISKPTEQLSLDHQEIIEGLKIELQHAPNLAAHDMASLLTRHYMFLTEEETSRRREAFALLKEVVLGSSRIGDLATTDIPLVMVTVGSYAMQVDTSGSDIDCLCIGTISSKTFFKLARQRLHKAESQGIRILRKVEASTGTMLELSVNGVAFDLQYCPAARVVER